MIIRLPQIPSVRALRDCCHGSLRWEVTWILNKWFFFFVHLGVWNQALKTTIAIAFYVNRANPIAYTFPSSIPANTPSSTANLVLLISWLCDDTNQFLCGISVTVTGNPTQRKKGEHAQKTLPDVPEAICFTQFAAENGLNRSGEEEIRFPNFTPFGDRPRRSSERAGKSLHSFPIHIQNEATGVACAESSVWTQIVWNLPFIDICRLSHSQTVALHPIFRLLCKNVDFWSLVWTFCVIFF